MLNNKYPNALARVIGGNLYPEINGIVSFYDVEGGTMVKAEFWRLPLYKPATSTTQPVGHFGFHIHEYGVCRITDANNPFESADGHYNPTNQPHGNYAGDFPVLFSNNGYAKMEFFTDKFKVEDVMSRSVLVHENPDDYRSQAAGYSGERVACGVI